MSVKGGKGKWDWAVTLDAGLTKPRSAWKGALEQILPVASCCMGPKWPHLCALISRSCQMWVSQEAHDLRWDNSGTKVDLEGADVWSCWSQSLDQDSASLCLPPKKASTVEQHTAVGNYGSIPLGTHWASAKNMPQDCPTKGWGGLQYFSTDFHLSLVEGYPEGHSVLGTSRQAPLAPGKTLRQSSSDRCLRREAAHCSHRPAWKWPGDVEQDLQTASTIPLNLPSNAICSKVKLGSILSSCCILGL